MTASGYPLLPAVSLFKLTGMILLNTFVYSAISYLLALLVHSGSAWGGLQTIMGTLVGFAGAIYLPVSMLPDGVMKVLKCLPVIHGAAMMREVCIQDALEKTFAGLPEVVMDIFKEKMGVSIMIKGEKADLSYQILLLMIYAVMAVALSVVVTKKRRLNDR